MAASTDKFKLASNGSRPSPTTLTALKAIGASSITVGALTGWSTTTGVDFCIYTTDTSGNKVAGSQTDWSGTASGTTISNLTLRAGTDNGYSIGAIVEAGPVAAWADDIASGMAVQHNQDGTHGVITATSVASAGAISGTTISGTALSASANLSMTGGTLTLTGFYDGWVNATDTWTYASATTFTISGVDRTAMFPAGTKIKLTQTTAKYFYVTASAFSTNTTVTITGGSDYTLANAAITSPAYSYGVTPQGFPKSFNFVPAWTNFTVGSATQIGMFSMNGARVSLEVSVILSGSTMGTGPLLTLPVTANAAFTTAYKPIGQLTYEDTGVDVYSGVVLQNTTTTAELKYYAGSNATDTFVHPKQTTSANPFSFGNTDHIFLTAEYYAA